MPPFDKYAQYYDLFYTEKDYALECNFLEQTFSDFCTHPPVSILDLACGTGNHGIPLAARGYRVTGVDRSAGMLSVYADKAKQAGVESDLICADMASLSLNNRYDAAICMFDAIGYLLDNRTISRFLSSISACLSDGGVFVFDAWHAAAFCRSYSPTTERTVQAPDGRMLRRVSETTLDLNRQCAEVAFHMDVLDGGGGMVDRFSERHTLRFFLVQELCALLEGNGWKVLSVCPAFDRDAKVTLASWHLVVMATPAR